MRKSTALGLTALVLGSVAVRLSPLWSFLYWGSDTGEYFAILRDLVRTGHVSTTYDGWGVTYPYFPGMFFLQGGLAHLSGLDLPTVLNVLVPILGALSVVPIFLIARRVTGEDRVALFAAAVLVGAIPHAYTTAHPAPATVGNLLALTGLLLFLRLRTDRAALVPLAVVSGTLIATHHLSLYFFLLMVLGTIIVQGLARPWRWTAGSKREVAYVSLLLAGTFVYWLVYATTFREFILTDVDIRPWWALLVLFGLGLVFLGGIIYARTRIGWRYRPRYPGLRYRGTAYASAVGGILICGRPAGWGRRGAPGARAYRVGWWGRGAAAGRAGAPRRAGRRRSRRRHPGAPRKSPGRPDRPRQRPARGRRSSVAAPKTRSAAA